MYLETYYPSRFDEELFFVALDAIDEQFSLGRGALDVRAFSTRYKLASEIIENASILYHLLSVASIIADTRAGMKISILDVGGGPTIYQHIPLSLIADRIVHAEPLEENRAEVLSYLRREGDAYDWDAYFRVMKRFLEQNGKFPRLSRRLAEILGALPNDGHLSLETAWRELIDDLMKSRVVPCDAFSPNLEFADEDELSRVLAQSGMSRGATLVESNFLLESATDSIDEWRKGLSNLLRKVAEGGFFSMLAIRNANWYLSGGDRVPAVPVDESFLRKELEQQFFSVVELHVLTGSDKETFGYDGMIFMLAQKNMS